MKDVFGDEVCGSKFGDVRYYDTQVTAENIRTVYFIGTKNTRRTLIGTLVVGKQRLGCRGPGVMNYGDGASMVTGCRRETRSAIPRA